MKIIWKTEEQRAIETNIIWLSSTVEPINRSFSNILYKYSSWVRGDRHLKHWSYCEGSWWCTDKWWKEYSMCLPDLLSRTWQSRWTSRTGHKRGSKLSGHLAQTSHFDAIRHDPDQVLWPERTKSKNYRRKQMCTCTPTNLFSLTGLVLRGLKLGQWLHGVRLCCMSGLRPALQPPSIVSAPPELGLHPDPGQD